MRLVKSDQDIYKLPEKYTFHTHIQTHKQKTPLKILKINFIKFPLIIRIFQHEISKVSIVCDPLTLRNIKER
jgi:hypothetical protein